MERSDAPGSRPTPRRLLAGIARLDGVDLALRLTLLTLLLRPVGSPVVRPLTLALAALGLAVPGLLRQPLLWAGLAAATGLRVVLEWSLADNHSYLLAYWCLAVTLALVSRDVAGCLALNGRLLVGWAFAFAVLWKLALSPDYLDGRFFRVTFLTDDRFADFTRLVGGLGAGELAELRAFIGGRADATLPPPHEPPRFRWVARAATFGTVGLEAAVALAFLWPSARGIARLRDPLLIGFCLTTYAVATVAGFGWLLLAMGIAQCDPRRPRARLAYLGAFLVVLAYRELAFMRWVLDRLALS